MEQFDEGWYCCVAVNECGNTTKCGWLEVDSKLTYSKLIDYNYLLATPKIIQQPSNVTVRASSRWEASLTVVATGKRPINYQWERYIPGSNSWENTKQWWCLIGGMSSVLKFRCVAEKFEGFYRCIVSNDDGIVASSSAFVSVYGM